MKKLSLLLLCVALVVMSFAGCSKPAATEEAAATDATPAATVEDTVEPIVIQIGYANNPGEPLDLAVNEWKRLIEERSNGEIVMEIFPSSQLGSKNDLIDQMLAGDSVITLADGAFYADRGVADFGIVFAPFVFDSWDEAWNLTKSDWYQEQSDQLAEKGLRILTSNWKYGDRHTMTVKPVRTVEDLKGMKIRVPNNTIQIKGFEALGATPTPMALGEVYTSLQQGTIDGLENPLTVLYNGKFQEVAKYLILDGHVKNFTTWVAGEEFFNSLTPEQQQLLKETGDEAGIYNNDIQDKIAAETIEKLKAEGVEIIDINIDEFKDKAMSFYDMPEIKAMWSEGLYDTVKDAMK
ncbi:MAG: C4-dicarboxylate TRAP transporter substrate-binding protein [Clostridia bacterium]|nr:C4-dicarboxylate TRAP transporter substrate-binding protein [Clostridia bacterium]